MSDELPKEPSDAVYSFFEMFALAFAFSAVESWVAGRSLFLIATCLFLSMLLFVIGAGWARFSKILGEPKLLEFVAKYRLLLIAAVVAYLFLTQHGTRVRYFALSFAALYVFISLATYIRRIRIDLDKYAMPRQLSDRQVKKLQLALRSHAARSIALKVDPHDVEAINYAGSILNVLQSTGWSATLDTTQPYNLNEGLGFLELGTNTGASLKADTKIVLERAFSHARIPVNHGGGVGAGEYRVFITVGRRPIAIASNESILSRIGKFLQSHGRRR